EYAYPNILRCAGGDDRPRRGVAFGRSAPGRFVFLLRPAKTARPDQVEVARPDSVHRGGGDHRLRGRAFYARGYSRPARNCRKLDPIRYRLGAIAPDRAPLY